MIVNKMEGIIGPIAIMLANKVPGLTASSYKVAITGDPEKVTTDLLNSYKKVIGASAVTIAQKSVASLLHEYPNLKVPKELRGD